MSKRRLPPPKSIGRKIHRYQPKKKIFVVSEGEKTEPRYLLSFSKDRGGNLIKLIIEDKHGVPITLVKQAIAVKKKQQRLAKRSGDSFGLEYEVWAIFDVDEHPRLAEAINTADGNGIKCAVSNPCFELWGLLHFERHDAPAHRREIQRKLASRMPRYERTGGKEFDYPQIRDSYESAKSNAIRINRNRIDEGNENGCPSTNVYELLDSLIGP